MEKATIYDYARLCRTVITCDNCPMCATRNGINSSCDDLLIKNPDKANEIILKWCEEHPIKTRQSEFLKMFPNVRIDDNAVVRICPIFVDANFNCVSIDCPKCREEYWFAEVDENE